jgi:hypothetical protein
VCVGHAIRCVQVTPSGVCRSRHQVCVGHAIRCFEKVVALLARNNLLDSSSRHDAIYTHISLASRYLVGDGLAHFFLGVPFLNGRKPTAVDPLDLRARHTAA